MFIPRLYYPHSIQTDEVLALDKEMSHYLMTVLRLSDGAKVIFFNGEGGEFSGTFIADKKRAQVKINEFHNVSRESPIALHLGQALLRGDKMDLVIQKATELGAHSITPVLSAHCAVKLPADRQDKRLEHWQNIAQSACEQSGRTQLPVIHTPTTLHNWSQQAFTGVSLFGDTQNGKSLHTLPQNTAYRLAIGPESGWSDAEIKDLSAVGFTGFTLGPRILRTETAGLAALSVLQALFGDLSISAG